MTIISVNETGNANGFTTDAQIYEGAQNLASPNEMNGKVLVDAEAYWRLRKDLLATQKIVNELLTRMRFIHDGSSIAEHDYPIHEVVSR
ncbi:hypothetical protein [Xenorhabdus szentirmaii]|uniref:Uncharacterized protein n=1 Tax=Xenorhabdus szentirmaii DSM 16338 TaxID=1427518 RepID=W1J3Y4_9GAMM|nr:MULTISPECIES: hypothetical protein [Xenorhabdus]MBD2803503.1 hypothetical protein [Xenorhabdus sp. ZM]PHM32013.1 hypothetical protein Xsze_02741 [Xenorhabdus szentirmaii DSM 16338]CDL85419.1 hypothetical protein XSR1_70157 [Xenorhabdus szentirmaii DSM 16338]